MKTNRVLFILFLFFLMIAMPAAAQTGGTVGNDGLAGISVETAEASDPADKEFLHAVNICAIAIPLMNLYVLNYEYLLEDHHGLSTRLEFIPLDGGEAREFNAGLNAGYRYIHDATGLNVTIAAGYGYSWTNENLSSSDSAVQDAYNAFKLSDAGTVNFLDAQFFGEVSFGYAF